NLTDARDYIDNTDADKRWEWVEKLLESPQYANHFAAIWREHLLTNANNQFAQGLTPQFETWLRDRLKTNTGYDRMVHELLTSSNNNFNNNFGQPAGSPAAFFFGNEN